MEAVCIVRLGAFGDILHSLPLAADLQAGGFAVDWLCEDRWACLLQGSPAIRQVWELPRARWRSQATDMGRRVQETGRLLASLRRLGYRAVIDAQGLAKSALLARAIGACTIGHRRPRAREGSHLLHRQLVPCEAEHVIDQQRSLSLPLLGHHHPGGDWRFPLPAWPRQQSRIDVWLNQQQLERPWALNVGAGWPTKIWPHTQQEDYLRLLAARGERPLVLWGGKTEGAWADDLCATIPAAVKAPPTDLPELACLLRRCRLLVSGDTGPLHLARAVSCPAIGLFGPVPATRNGVRGAGYDNFQAPSEPWERHDVTRARMHHIEPQAVFARACALFGESP